VCFTAYQITKLLTKTKEKKYRNRERERERDRKVVNERRREGNKKKERECGKQKDGKKLKRGRNNSLLNCKFKVLRNMEKE